MEASDLMENVRSFFIEQYKGVDSSNSFISFEPLGSIIDPTDFEAENDVLSEIKAMEQLSVISDRLPEIEPIFLTNTYRLSNVYEELIASAEFCGDKISAVDKTAYISRFGDAKNGALQKLSESKRASIVTPEGDYLPVSGYPKKWYKSESPFWVSKTFSAEENEEKPLVAANTGFPKLMPLTWRTKIIANPETLKAVVKEPITFTNNIVTTIPTLRKTNIISRSAFSKIGDLQHLQSLKRTEEFRVLGTNAKLTQSVESYPKVALKDLSVLKQFNFSDRIRLTNNLIKMNPEHEAPIHSNGFSMSFQYCLVYLERSWFDSALFHYSNIWYSLSLRENYFSTGAKDHTNNGVLKCMSTAMILIKDLRIKAVWTAEDKQFANTSVGLGVFNISGNTINRDNELTTPGMQIIGWVCEVLPKLPIMTDPYLIIKPNVL